MYNFVFIVHVIVSLLLVIVILIQRGRGGGLVEALSGAESLFGTKTSNFLVRSTTILAIVFFVTSTSLAFFSKQRERSLLERGANIEKLQEEQENTPISNEETEDKDTEQKAPLETENGTE